MFSKDEKNGRLIRLGDLDEVFYSQAVGRVASVRQVKALYKAENFSEAILSIR